MAGIFDPSRFAGAATLVAAANAIFRRDRGRAGTGAVATSIAGPHLAFDATIILHGHLRDAGLGDQKAAEALRAVRTEVESMGGAGWITVEYVGPWADGWSWMRRAERVTLYRPWNPAPQRGPEWDHLRGTIEETVRLALAEVAGP